MEQILPSQWPFLNAQQRILESKECLASLHGKNDCNGRIVCAHMIPRSQLLQISDQGHVCAVPTRFPDVAHMKRSGFKAKEIGIGQFSTLNCFCAHHDKSLFAPIEDKPLTFTPEQLAVLHYRAISAEAYLRRTSEAGMREEMLKYRSDDPRRAPFYTLFYLSSIAAQAAEDAPQIHRAHARTLEL